MNRGQAEETGPVYDKGDRRYKHVGRNPYPEFRSENDPRRIVGLCPNNVAHADHQCLLQEAIPDSNGDPIDRVSEADARRPQGGYLPRRDD